MSFHTIWGMYVTVSTKMCIIMSSKYEGGGGLFNRPISIHFANLQICGIVKILRVTVNCIPFLIFYVNCSRSIFFTSVNCCPGIFCINYVNCDLSILFIRKSPTFRNVILENKIFYLNFSDMSGDIPNWIYL